MDYIIRRTSNWAAAVWAFDSAVPGGNFVYMLEAGFGLAVPVSCLLMACIQDGSFRFQQQSNSAHP